VPPVLPEAEIGFDDDPDPPTYTDAYAKAIELAPYVGRAVDTGLLGVDDTLVETGEAVPEVPVFTDDEIAELQALADDDLPDVPEADMDGRIELWTEGEDFPEPTYTTVSPVRGSSGTLEPVFVRDDNSAFQEKIKAYYEAREERRDTVYFDTETPMTPEEQRGFTRICDRLGDIADALGVPEARDRLTKPHHVHIFDKQDDTVDVIQHHLGAGDEAEEYIGASEPSHGVVWTRHEDEVANMSGLGHEVAHEMGTHTFRPNEDAHAGSSQQVKVTTGYSHISHGLNEWVVDMLDDRAMQMEYGESALGYVPTDVIGDAVLRETAAWHGEPPQAIEDDIERGYLNGDMTGIDKIAAALGPERMELFCQLSGDESPETSQYVAVALGLPEAAAAIQDMLDEKEIALFAWR
jgi:hypothetical protein